MGWADGRISKVAIAHINQYSAKRSDPIAIRDEGNTRLGRRLPALRRFLNKSWGEATAAWSQKENRVLLGSQSPVEALRIKTSPRNY